MVFDGEQHLSVLSHPLLRRRSFAVFSFGKTYHATGWKLAYCIARPALSEEFGKFISLSPSQRQAFCSTPSPTSCRSAPSTQPSCPPFYQAKRDYFCTLLQDSRFRFSPSNGTYFQLVDYSAISSKDDMAFVTELTQEKGVAAIPLAPFYREALTPNHPFLLLQG